MQLSSKGKAKKIQLKAQNVTVKNKKKLLQIKCLHKLNKGTRLGTLKLDI